MTQEIVLLEGVRTGFGSFGGSLKDLSATDLGVIAAKCALERSKVDPAWIDHTVFGNVVQTSGDAIYLARHIGLKSGVPIEKPALTLNRLCGSGQEAIVTGARMILNGEADFVLAGGTESMSQAPHIVRGARWGIGFGANTQFEDMLWTALVDSYTGLPMAITAEKLAEQYHITREEQDRFSLASQQNAKKAWDENRLQEEIVPIPLKDRKGNVTNFAKDEIIRGDATMEGLAKLPARFKKEGTVTAGNASGIVDGAAAVVVTTMEKAKERGLKPLGRLVSWGTAGVDPSVMGIGPAPAIRMALKKAGLSLQDMDLVEVNEAFAAQALAVAKELEIDLTHFNVNGGAIAIGHPLGATGARLTLTILYELRRRNKRYGVASMCIGGGQGIAAIVEAL
ncbi:MAG: acetyl-CoA C-acetyltransferase [Chloroflexi bacterium]|nr:acetyl-CoA C-acetyltransferase [Chloroflexota bacterium]